MQEPGEVVDVIDAFDDGDPLRPEPDSASASATRPRAPTSCARRRSPRPGLTTGGFTTHTLNVADYSETTARLIPRIDIGIYHDIALHVSLPVILSNARSALARSAASAPSRRGARGRPGRDGSSASRSQSPTRSGLQYIGAGLDFDILEPGARPHEADVALRLRGPLLGRHADARVQPNAPTGQVQCADPSDINRNGKCRRRRSRATSTSERRARTPASRAARSALEVHTLMSKRIKYVEPYGGFTALFEFQQSSSDYGLTDLNQTLVNHPPLVGTMIARA